MKRLLRGGRVVDPANGLDGQFDVLIEGDRIARVGRNLPVDGATVHEVPGGLVVCPGFIDMHVHLREPGQEHKETVATGTASAVAGGFSPIDCRQMSAPPLAIRTSGHTIASENQIPRARTTSSAAISSSPVPSATSTAARPERIRTRAGRESPAGISSQPRP